MACVKLLLSCAKPLLSCAKPSSTQMWPTGGWRAGCRSRRCWDLYLREHRYALQVSGTPVGVLEGFAMPCFAVLCDALPCFALRCVALPCFALRCLALLCFAVLCDALLCLALPCLALLCDALPCLALLCCAVRCLCVVQPWILRQPFDALRCFGLLSAD